MGAYEDYIGRQRERINRYNESKTPCTSSAQCASGFGCFGGICARDYSGGESGNTGGCGGGSNSLFGEQECTADGVTPVQQQIWSKTASVDFEFAELMEGHYQDWKDGLLLGPYTIGGKYKEASHSNVTGWLYLDSDTVGLFVGGRCVATGCGGAGRQSSTGLNCCSEERCWRVTTSGIVGSCGPCPEGPACDKFCTSYKQANGESASSCTSGQQCSECETCEQVGSVTSYPYVSFNCRPKEKNHAPVHCNPNGNQCQDCTSNVCVEDNENCTSCRERRINCSCGDFIQTCCEQFVPNISLSGTSDGSGIMKLVCPEFPCSDVCPEDDCAGTCENLTIPNGNPLPECPDGFDCRQTGVIEAGGKVVKLYEQCDKSGVPEHCGKPDCNCDADCPDCQRCGSGGYCIADNACD